jgi:hypothetical protein
LRAAENVVGRNVSDLLREAQSVGVRIIFTDRAVPADLRVTQEPRSHEPLERLREILQVYGLKLDEVSSGTYVVIGEPRAAPLPAAESPQEVWVTASRYTIDALADAPFALDSAQIDRQTGLFDDAARSIRRFPGTAGQDLSSRIYVRGGTPDDNLLLLDGIPLYDPFHLPNLPINFSVIDPAVVGRVDFYSGVMPVEYGDRMGAVVNTSLREPGQDFGGRIALSALAGSALLSGPLTGDRGDWLAFGRRGLLGQFVSMDSPQLGRPQLLDGLGRVRYWLDDGSLVTVGGLVASDSAHVRFADGSVSEDDSSSRRYAWAVYDLTRERLKSRTTLSLTSLAANHAGEVRDSVGSSGSLRDDRDFNSVLLRQDWTLDSNARNAMRWGVSLRADRAHFDFDRALDFEPETAETFGRPATSDSRLDDTVSSYEIESYWGATRTFGTSLTLDAGVRGSYTHYSTHQSNGALDPRASLRFDVTDATRLRYSMGRMTQMPVAAALPVEQLRDRFDPPSTNTMYVAALEHDFGSWLTLRGEAFAKHIAHPQPRIENVFFPNAFMPELRADRLVFAPQSSRMQGFDLYATVTFSERISGWLSYSRSIATDQIDGRAVPRPWNQVHSGGLGLAFAWRATRFSADAFAHSNWPLTPPKYGFQPADPVTGVPAHSFVMIEPRQQYGGGLFLSLNLKAEQTFPFDSGSLHLALEVSNATNHPNTCCNELTFRDLGDNFANGEFEQRHWLPLTPYASIAWEF